VKSPLTCILLFALASANAGTGEVTGAEGIKKCQDNAQALRQHGFCSQGDSACVQRLGNELELNVGKVCQKALKRCGLSHSLPPLISNHPTRNSAYAAVGGPLRSRLLRWQDGGAFGSATPEARVVRPRASTFRHLDLFHAKPPFRRSGVCADSGLTEHRFRRPLNTPLVLTMVVRDAYGYIPERSATHSGQAQATAWI